MQIRKSALCKPRYASRWSLAIAMFFAVLAWSSSASAQVLYGSLTGIVTDASGAVVPNAKITAVEVSKGIAQNAEADATGIYRITNILPGIYKVTVAAPGFAAQVTGNLGIEGNAVRRLDAQLMPAGASETVTVSTAPPDLQTDRADIHTDITSQELQSLPAISSEGKNFQALLRIVPGASLPAENNSAASNPSRAMTSNVNGQSSQGNSTRVDGVLDLDPWLPNNVAYVPPTAAIESVNMATNSMDAEQGMANGASVNVQIKSGTNKFHGDVREYHTDNALKNLNYFNPSGYKKPLNVFNQFGASLGGPILKNRLFFFGNWESTRQVSSPSGGNPQTVPTGGLLYANAKSNGFFDFRGLAVDKAGNPVHIYDPRTGSANGANRTPISCNGTVDTLCLSQVDPAALILAALTPAPNQSGTTSNFLDLQKGYFHRDNYDGKVNYVPNANSQIFGHFSMTRALIYDPPVLGTAGGGATNGGQAGYSYPDIYVIGLGGTHTFTANLLLDANVGFTRQHISALDTDITEHGDYGLQTLKIPGTNDDGMAATNKFYWGIPAFTFASYSSLGNSSPSNPFIYRDNQYSGNVNLTWVKGRHQFRFGFEDSHTQLNHFQPQANNGSGGPRGSFSFSGVATEQVTCGTSCAATDAPTTLQFNSYADFLMGLPNSTAKTVLTVNPIALRWNQIALYARDQWQVTPTLSVDYGLRWEFYPMAYGDHNGGARVLDPSTMNVYIGGHGSVPDDAGVKVGHGEFLPRLGVAWRPDAKTVVRLGFGMGADANNWRYLRNDYPAGISTSWSGQNTGGAVNYNQFSPAASLTGVNATGPYVQLPTGTVLMSAPDISTGVVSLPSGLSDTTIPRNFRRGYIYSYNLTVEREFAGFVADIGYVGTRAIRPVVNLEINEGVLGGGSAGRVLNAQFGKNWADINELTPFGNNYYDSLQAKLARRIGRASTVGVVYTRSKAIDFEDNEDVNTMLWSLPSLLWKNKGLTSFDRPNNFEAYLVYDLPFGKGQRWAQKGVANAVAGGWQFSSVMSVLSGTPFTIVDSGAGTSNLNAPNEQQTVNIVSPIHILKGRPAQAPSKCTTNSCRYFDPSSFARVTAAGVLGNAGRNIVRGPGYFDLDATIHRDFKIREWINFQLEANAIGVTNTPHFGNPTADLNSSSFGIISGTLATSNASMGGSGGERQWFVGGKFIF